MSEKRLEELSDKVRRGEPIPFSNAIEVIQYQEDLKKNRKLKNKFIKFFDKLLNIK